jgi:bifunctional enzyme CysN/CysC/sulfate adenylyltransferase subunit 1
MYALANGGSDRGRILAAHGEKALLRLVVAGSVDDGKSTLIGRLLYECGGLFEDQIAAVRKASARRAGHVDEEELDFSLFTDGLMAEREQGITIDVAYRYLTTARRKIVIADTPGHLQYTRNMATGASTADAAVLLVDVTLGVLDQTRRHAYIASLLGIPFLAVAVNKMDLVGFDRAAFERVSTAFLAFAQDLGFRDVRLFPVSGRGSDNVARTSARTPWYEGGTLLGWLESLPTGREANDAPLRLPVQAVLRPDATYRGFAGQIASGTLRPGDEVVVWPSGRRTRVAAVDSWSGALESASAPASVTVRLADEVDVARGDLLASSGTAPLLLDRLEATLIWFGDEPLDPARRYLLKQTSRVVPAQVEEVRWRKDLESLAEIPARTLAQNDIGLVRLSCRRPLVCDPYRENRRTGAFIVIDARTNDTVAAGMILGAAEGMEGVDRSLVPPEDRVARLGQRGAVVIAESAVVAARLERELFVSGRLTAYARSDVELALGLAEAGLVAAVHAPTSAARRALRESGMHVVEHVGEVLDTIQKLEGWP